MSTVQEAILANAADYTRLVTTIGNLEYVPEAVKQQESEVADLRSQLAGIQEHATQLVRQSTNQKKKHESLRDSKLKKWAYKSFSTEEKYEAKVSKRESRFTEALGKATTAQNDQAAVQQLLNEAHHKLTDLKGKEEYRLSLIAELKALYDRVFNGRKESFPEDNRLENALREAEEYHDKIQAKITSEDRAAQLLAAAVNWIDSCQISMRDAMIYFEKKIQEVSAGKNNTKTSQKLIDALASAQNSALSVTQAINQAIQASPRVKSIKRVDIRLDADRLKERIEQVLDELILWNQQVKAELSSARLRIDEAGEQLEQASRASDRCRQELYELRKATFQSIINSSKHWQSMLVIAKNNMRRHVALTQAFPKREKHEATLILTKAIDEFKEEKEGNEFDDLFIPDRETSILTIAKEHSNLRAQMKEVAREVVKSKYSDILFPPDFKGNDMVKTNVIELLDNGKFLRGGVDENNKTMNLSHPSIEALALQFYYTGDDCLANLSPGAFNRTISDHALAFLMTCIQNCLEEYAQDGYQRQSIDFEGEKYRSLQQNYLEMINDCKQNQYHGPRFEARRAEWAHKGMKQLKGTSHRRAATLLLD